MSTERHAVTGSQATQPEKRPENCGTGHCSCVECPFEATQPTQAEAPSEREALIDLIAQHLSGTYHCTRVWEAWRVGTMSQEDFEPVDESDTPAELADAILAALATQQPDLPAYYVSGPYAVGPNAGMHAVCETATGRIMHHFKMGEQQAVTVADVNEAYTRGRCDGWDAAALAEPPRKQLATPGQVPEFNGWYCAHCQCGVDGSEVTFREQHTVCGRVITNDRPPAPEQVERDREDAALYVTALQMVADLAHEGGLITLSEHEALVAVRRLTLPWWDKTRTHAQRMVDVERAAREAKKGGA